MFWSFVIFTLLSQYTPGPNNLMAMANGARFGVRGTMRFTIGVVIAGAVLGLLGVLFYSVLHSLIPQLAWVMRIFASLYMVCLAWWIFRSRHDKLECKAGGNHLNSVKIGFLLQFVNPKLILFCITVASVYLVPLTGGEMWLIAAYLLGMCLTALGANMAWAKFGELISSWLSHWHLQINYILCLLVLWCAWDVFRG